MRVGERLGQHLGERKTALRAFPALTCRTFLYRRFAAGGMAAVHFFAALGVATQTRGAPEAPVTEN
jgi:hypothetical protein